MMQNFFVKLITLTPLILYWGMIAPAQGSEIYIQVGQAQVKKSLIAFPPLQLSGSSARHQSIGTDIYRTIFNNLNAVGYFQFISPEAFLEDTSKTSPRPAPGDPQGFRFQSWQTIGAEFLIRATYSVSGNQIELETFLYHVPRSHLILNRKYQGRVGSERRIAHTFSNDVMRALTGSNGMFLSRIVAGTDRGGGRSREIYIMDWDGENAQRISRHNSIALSPAWSPDGKKIAYTAYVTRRKSGKTNADMFLYDIPSGERKQLSYREGINSGAVFMPDGQSILMTITQNQSPDIYRINLEGNVMQRLTAGPSGALNVEPAISPDGRRVLFSSTRAGNPMLYVMNIDGSGARRLTMAGRYNASPAWSPDGQMIAFAGQMQGSFDIFVMNADGSNIRRLTDAKLANGRSANNEDPTFSPCGRHIMFTSNRTGNNQIFMINPDGSNERRITNDNFNYYKPKWSNNIE